mmetsp:Transcript_9415/g.15219  ORF Transcript_9415/g.15219 Transcript_9415/m.15219 type:complete len:227 (+) Transcript_9415:124-804(+)
MPPANSFFKPLISPRLRSKCSLESIMKPSVCRVLLNSTRSPIRERAMVATRSFHVLRKHQQWCLMSPTHEKFWFDDVDKTSVNVTMSEFGIEQLNEIITLQTAESVAVGSELEPLTPLCQIDWEDFVMDHDGSEPGWKVRQGSRFLNSFPCKTSVSSMNYLLVNNPHMITGLGDEWLLKLRLEEEVSLKSLIDSGLLMTTEQYDFFCGTYDIEFRQHAHNSLSHSP